MKTTPAGYLQKQYRTSFLQTPLWFAIAGLVIAFGLAWFFQPKPFLAPPHHLALLMWAGTILLSLSIALAISLSKRHSLAEAARRLDARHSTNNRLEAVVELAESRHPLAQAQNAETESWLETHDIGKISKGFPIAAAVFFILLLAHFFLGGIWTFRSLTWSKPAPKIATVAVPPHAEFRWKSPKSEIKATKVEEIPWVAEAQSTTGLKNVTLEIDVNGVHKMSIPVKADSLDKKGAHPITSSLYLDELEVEPFDVVNYYLRGERVFKKPLSATTSEMQFVQIRPFREDVAELPPGTPMSKAADILTALKVAQLRAMKQNFVLAGAELAKTDPLWKTENQRVGTDQKRIAGKLNEALPVLVEAGASAEMINLLMQAKPYIQKAGELITATENTKATPEQGHALALITECEKLFRKVLSQSKGKSPTASKPPVKDPFADAQKFKLKPREQTPAGSLEKLALDQAKLLSEISKPGQCPADASTRQEGISQEMAKASAGGSLPEDTRKELDEAGKAAKESTGQLKSGDPVAAQEPAARALQHLKAAINAMDAAGREAAAKALAEAQRQLNEAAAKTDDPNGDPAKAAEQAAAAAEAMKAEAERQQENGSAAAAKALAGMSQKISESKVNQSLAARAAHSANAPDAKEISTKLEALARLAASEQTRLSDRQEALAQTLDELQRAKVNLARLAAKAAGSPQGSPGSGKEPGKSGQESGDKPAPGKGQTPGQEPGTGEGKASGTGTSGDAQAQQEILADILASTQKAEMLLPGSGAMGMGQLLKDRETKYAPFTAVAAAIDPPLEEWISLLSKAVTGNQRDETVKLFRPDDAPAPYRDAVADYFEQLSKDFQKSEKTDH